MVSCDIAWALAGYVQDTLQTRMSAIWYIMHLRTSKLTLFCQDRILPIDDPSRIKPQLAIFLQDVPQLKTANTCTIENCIPYPSCRLSKSGWQNFQRATLCKLHLLSIPTPQAAHLSILEARGLRNIHGLHGLRQRSATQNYDLCG